MLCWALGYWATLIITAHLTIALLHMAPTHNTPTRGVTKGVK